MLVGNHHIEATLMLGKPAIFVPFVASKKLELKINEFKFLCLCGGKSFCAHFNAILNGILYS